MEGKVVSVATSKVKVLAVEFELRPVGVDKPLGDLLVVRTLLRSEPLGKWPPCPPWLVMIVRGWPYTLLAVGLRSGRSKSCRGKGQKGNRLELHLDELTDYAFPLKSVGGEESI